MGYAKKFRQFVKDFQWKCSIICKNWLVQVFIQGILMSIKRHKKLNLLIKFLNSIFMKF